MRIVVNRLAFKEPIGRAVLDAADEAARLLVESGGLSFDFVQTGESHAMLVLAFPDLEVEQRITSEIGGPWMREHIIPLLDGPPQRTSGEVVAGLR